MEGTPATTSLPPTPDVNQELAELKQKTTTLEHTLSELKTLIMGLEKPTTEVSSNEPEEQK